MYCQIKFLYGATDTVFNVERQQHIWNDVLFVMLLCVWTTVLLFRTAWSYQQYGKMFALHCISVAIKIWWHEKSFVLRTPLSLTLSLPLSLSPHCVCSSLPPLSLPSLSLYVPPSNLSLSLPLCMFLFPVSPPPPPPLVSVSSWWPCSLYSWWGL